MPAAIRVCNRTDAVKTSEADEVIRIRTRVPPAPLEDGSTCASGATWQSALSVSHGLWCVRNGQSCRATRKRSPWRGRCRQTAVPLYKATHRTAGWLPSDPQMGVAVCGTGGPLHDLATSAGHWLNTAELMFPGGDGKCDDATTNNYTTLLNDSSKISIFPPPWAAQESKLLWSMSRQFWSFRGRFMSMSGQMWPSSGRIWPKPGQFWTTPGHIWSMLA